MSKLIIPYRECRNVTPAFIKQVGDAWNDFFDALQEMNISVMWASTQELEISVRNNEDMN